MKRLSSLLLAAAVFLPVNAALSGDTPRAVCTPEATSLDTYLVYHEFVSPAPLPSIHCHHTCSRTGNNT